MVFCAKMKDGSDIEIRRRDLGVVGSFYIDEFALGGGRKICSKLDSGLAEHMSAENFNVCRMREAMATLDAYGVNTETIR